MDRNLQQSLTAWALIRCCDAFAEFKGLYSEDQYFHIALSQLLPTVQGASDTLISESSRTRSSRRILSLYLIYALYAPHPISLNPFHTILSSTARALSSSHPSQADGILGDMMLLRYLEVILADQGSTLDGLIPGGLESAETVSPDASKTEPDSSLAASSSKQRDTPTSPPKVLDDERMSRLFEECQTRVLSLSEQRYFIAALNSLSSDTIRGEIGPASIPKLSSLNQRLCVQVIRRIFDATDHSANEANFITELEPYFVALSSLPPTLGSFDLIGNLLLNGRTDNLTASSPSAPKNLISLHVLPRFIGNCLQHVYALEREESAEDLDIEGHYARTVQLLCKFVLSVIRNDTLAAGVESAGIVHAFNEGLDIELTNFALQNSRISEANALYGTMARRHTGNRMYH